MPRKDSDQGPAFERAGRTTLRMGLIAINDQQWVEPFNDEENRFSRNHKKHVIRQDPTTIQISESAIDATREWYFELKRHLLRDHPHLANVKTLLQPPLPHSPARDLLTILSYSIPDDICILQHNPRQENSAYCLTAASVQSPSLWHPREKIGQPLASIHSPVPDIASRLMPAMERLLRHLKSGRPVARYNWSLQPDQRLNRQPETEPAIAPETPLFYRCERQALIRMPATDAIVFLIRTRVWPLENLTSISQGQLTPEQILRAALQLPLREQAYKGIQTLQPAFIKYLS
ncbi:MAG: DUF3445 domain-containing protein [Pseudomonadota bacterium]|nr:DUF3445 domain-containing protein [Pseudomonadota bacterium]